MKIKFIANILSIILLTVACKDNKQVQSLDSPLEEAVKDTSSEKMEGSICEGPLKKTVSVEILDTCGLRIYHPNYSHIDLVCGKMPQKSEDSVILVCAAAYTVKRLDHFEHTNIIGNHVSGGVLHKGAASKSYRGAFTFYDGQPHFTYDNWNGDFHQASTKGGCGFAQDMMIHKGGIVNHWREDSSKNQFRALCLIDGKVAVADSKEVLPFRDFIQNLINAGATEAIYLDMGGWKHSWRRDEKGDAVDIYPNPTKYGTNWITFYK